MNKILTSLLGKNGSFPYIRIVRKSFSEEGEDILIQNFFDNSYKGFYVDIGYFHKIYSNTYFFYRNNWKGLNIFCNPIEKSLVPIRRRDKNIYCDSKSIVLSQIFKANLPPKSGFLSDCVDIDILNIDVPGEEIKIILTNNWKIFRPKIILVSDSESNCVNMFNPNSLVFQNLWAHNYILFAKTTNALIFKERNINKIEKSLDHNIRQTK